MHATRMLMIIISQINLLLGSLNDLLDLKLIEENKFVPKKEIFSPSETFTFILTMFAPVIEIQNCKLDFLIVPHGME